MSIRACPRLLPVTSRSIRQVPRQASKVHLKLRPLRLFLCSPSCQQPRNCGAAPSPGSRTATLNPNPKLTGLALNAPAVTKESALVCPADSTRLCHLLTSSCSTASRQARCTLKLNGANHHIPTSHDRPPARVACPQPRAACDAAQSPSWRGAAPGGRTAGLGPGQQRGQ